MGPPPIGRRPVAELTPGFPLAGGPPTAWPGRRQPALSIGRRPWWQRFRPRTGGVQAFAQEAVPFLASGYDYSYTDPLKTLGQGVFEEGDQEFLDEILAMRRGLQYPRVNPLSLDWWRSGPIQQRVSALGDQGRFGIPEDETYYEANRFRPLGIGRGQVRQGA